jgi:membrane protein
VTYLYILLQAAKIWLERGASYYSAAFSYYAPLALVPLVFFSVSVAGFLYGDTFTRDVFSNWGAVMGDDLLGLIRIGLDNLHTETAESSAPLLAVSFFLGFYIIALNVVADGFLRLWGRESRGLVAFIKKSLRAGVFLFVLQAYLILVIGLDYFIVPTVLGNHSPLASLILYSSTVVFFVILYRFITSRPPSYGGCIYGALIASLFFVVIKYLVYLYIATTPVLTLYGAAGLILVLFVWVYVLAAVVFYGAAVAGLYDRMKLNNSKDLI